MNTQKIADELILLKEKADRDILIQKYLSRAEIPGNVEYVRPERSGRRKGYFRRRPARNSLKQVEHRLKFSTVAYNQFNTKGVEVLNDGRIISKAAKSIGNELRGTGSTMDAKEKEREKLIQMIEPKEATAKKIKLSWI
ncbi:Uncharacterised protein [uncultured archaeon]|nr:Uncharacterised protein [uncultured archaeon]